MGKIVLMMSVSLDGFFEGPDRDIGWGMVDEEVHRDVNAYAGAMGAFLHGRVTHELMAEFWPTADANPESSGPEAEFARIWREMPKYVFSRTLERADWSTAVLHEVVPDEIRALKERTDGVLGVGGADLAASFRELGLIDEYRLYVHPVLIGRGRPLFQETDALTHLRLAENRTFGNGVVLLRYERVESAA